MQKIAFVLFMAYISTGCSVVKNVRSKDYGFSGRLITEQTLEGLKIQNVTENNFYIRKAEIEIITLAGREKFLGSLKFERPGKYLISIKSRTGIEGARVLISDDTLLINDRINRKQYYGSADYLLKKFGISNSVLPVILGDYIGDKISGNFNSECLDGKLDVESIKSGMKIKYLIDCKKGKPILAITENNVDKENIKITYEDFIKKRDFLTPTKIEIFDPQRNTTIKIKILKMESPWDGTIEFIPGNRYKILQLL